MLESLVREGEVATPWVRQAIDWLGPLVGEPVELILQAFGRGDHAQVAIEGDPDAVAGFTGGTFSF